ncbi:hypothetical protein PR002_g13475 [Phytophthora rubi]|uniref:Uncharacterized protein n=1 Tax=Phytophthora rubi TaxID=129364 RepID=A0A6A3LGG6_9STRA|nr:hypothetical protein PR002_g13475 [Phytophthora rubi]
MRSVQPQTATTADHGTSDPHMTHERVDATASAARDHLTRSGTIMDGHYAWEPYEKLSQDLIRKECTLREIKLNTRTNKADRIKCLRHYDALVNKGEGSSAASTMASGNTRRTKHCMFRLTNVLLSKNMVTRLIETTGKNFDRADLDDVQASQKALFWRDVAATYQMDDEEYSGLIADDADFDGIEPGTIVPHSAAMLEECWKELTSFYSIYEANFRLSGTNDREFKKFVHGKVDVLYLWYWTKIRPEVLNCARGGMYEEDEYDSLADSSATLTRERRSTPSATPSHRSGKTKRAARSPARSTPGKKQKTESDAMDVLVTLVGRIAAAREAEVALGREQEQEVSVRIRAEHHKMLDDIRKRISAIECEMSSAASPIKLRLQGDLNFFLEERHRIMENVRSLGQ